MLVYSLGEIKKDIIKNHMWSKIGIYTTPKIYIYVIFLKAIASPINNDLNYLMDENDCLYLKWNKDDKLYISYEKKTMFRYQVLYQLYLFQQKN